LLSPPLAHCRAKWAQPSIWSFQHSCDYLRQQGGIIMRHKGMTFCKLLCLLVLTLLLTGCAQQPQAPFDGVIATSDVVFNLDFTALNTTYTSTLIVPEGKEIMADIQCDGGHIDVTITPEDGEPIYTGKRLQTSSFSIVPKTPGKYTVTISGENASGYAHVYVEGAVHYDDEPAENK
jgi:hypothetical protein